MSIILHTVLLVKYFFDTSSAIRLLRRAKMGTPWTGKRHQQSRIFGSSLRLLASFTNTNARFLRSHRKSERKRKHVVMEMKASMVHVTMATRSPDLTGWGINYPEGFRLRIGNMIYCDFLYERLWKNKNFIWQICCHVFECDQFFLLIK